MNCSPQLMITVRNEDSRIALRFGIFYLSSSIYLLYTWLCLFCFPTIQVSIQKLPVSHMLCDQAAAICMDDLVDQK